MKKLCVIPSKYSVTSQRIPQDDNLCKLCPFRPGRPMSQYTACGISFQRCHDFVKSISKKHTIFNLLYCWSMYLMINSKLVSWITVVDDNYSHALNRFKEVSLAQYVQRNLFLLDLYRNHIFHCYTKSNWKWFAWVYFTHNNIARTKGYWWPSDLDFVND